MWKELKMVFEQEVIESLPEKIQSVPTKKLQSETSETRALQFTGHERMLSTLNSTAMTQQLELNRYKACKRQPLIFPSQKHKHIQDTI